MDVLALGLIIGIANGLLAVGLVLIYKANRVLNLAHGELGAFGVAMMLALTRAAHLNYWLALPCALAGTMLLAILIERGILRNLFRSPRLIVLIATIGIAQIVTVARLILPKPRTAGGESIFFGGGGDFPVPFRTPVIHFGRIVLMPAHFMLLVAGPLLVLGVVFFLKRSTYGVALRASAENATRARLLGIPVRNVSTVAWAVAALLAAAAGILLAPIIGFSATEAVGLPLLMRGLAAATVARMDSVPIAFGAGIGLGIIDQAVYFGTGKSGLTNIVLFLVILGVLVARPKLAARAGVTDETSWEVAEPVRPLPIEVREHPNWRAFMGGASIFAGVMVVSLPFLLGPSVILLVGSVALFGAVACSMTVLTGWAGQMSLGHWALAGVGGIFGSRLVTLMHLPFILAFIAAAIVGGVIALLLALPALRLEGIALAVVTLGFAVAAESWLFGQNWFRGTGALPRPALIGTPRGFYVVAVLMLATTIVALRALQRSRAGRNMVALRDNWAQAAAFGVPSIRTKLAAFVVSGVVASAAGFLWASGIVTTTERTFPAVRSLQVVAAVVIGGLGSIGGALLGALYILGIPYFLDGVWTYIGVLSSGVGLLFLLLFLPGGLSRLAFGARDLIARQVTGIDPRPNVIPVSAEAHMRELVVAKAEA